MFLLILLPVCIILGIGLLVWLFWKKRVAYRSYGERPSSENLSPPKILVKTDFKEQKVLRLKEIFRRLFAFYKNFGKKVSREDLFGTDREVRQDISEKGRLFGVSAVLPESFDKEKKLGIAGDALLSKREGYLRGRPMVSDRATLPQKRQEKDRYEQVLIERIALNPRDIEAYERLGDYYMENDNFIDAKECFKQVLRLSPLSRRSRLRMRRIEKILLEKQRNLPS